jgi:CRP/FNR family nitrogen fixation transcriptional regulator
MVAERDAVVTRNLLSMTTSNLQYAENHMLLLGRKTTLEKVAAFLLEMEKRLTAAGVMTLPMPRRDIADYLGLTIETVSRALAQPVANDPNAASSNLGLGVISPTNRNVVVSKRPRRVRFLQPSRLQIGRQEPWI